MLTELGRVRASCPRQRAPPRHGRLMQVAALCFLSPGELLFRELSLRPRVTSRSGGRPDLPMWVGPSARDTGPDPAPLLGLGVRRGPASDDQRWPEAGPGVWRSLPLPFRFRERRGPKLLWGHAGEAGVRLRLHRAQSRCVAAGEVLPEQRLRKVTSRASPSPGPQLLGHGLAPSPASAELAPGPALASLELTDGVSGA